MVKAVVGWLLRWLCYMACVGRLRQCETQWCSGSVNEDDVKQSQHKCSLRMSSS